MALSSAYFRNIPKQLDFAQAEGSSAIARVFKKTRAKSQSPKKRNKKGLEKKRGGQARIPISSMMPSACPNNRNICFCFTSRPLSFSNVKKQKYIDVRFSEN
jgi:hypothetical protein